MDFLLLDDARAFVEESLLDDSLSVQLLALGVPPNSNRPVSRSTSEGLAARRVCIKLADGVDRAVLLVSFENCSTGERTLAHAPDFDDAIFAAGVQSSSLVVGLKRVDLIRVRIKHGLCACEGLLLLVDAEPSQVFVSRSTYQRKCLIFSSWI